VFVAENNCAAYTFGTGVVSGDTDGCTADIVLSTHADNTCSVKCDAGYVAQTGTITCAAAAAADAATSGAPTCVGAWLPRLHPRVLCTQPAQRPPEGRPHIPRRASPRALCPLLSCPPLLVFVAEQTCAVDSDLTTYDANAVADTCGTTLNALTVGTTTCTLGCDAGYIVTSSTLTCAPDGNAATGTLTSAVTCTGSDPDPCSATRTASA